jgi:hypothetical protein
MMTRRTICAVSYFAFALVTCLSFATFVSIIPTAAQTPAGGALSEPQDVNGASGLVAEIVQCKRAGSVLSVRMRLRNTGSEKKLYLKLVHGGNYDGYYLVAGNKKYFVLRDSEKTPLANPTNTFSKDVETTIQKGGSFIWYAKYPAPPNEVKKITYYTPITAPFEDIPVSE